MAEGEGRLSLWGIEVFLAVAEEGSLSAAARRLGVTPSAISQALAALELSLHTTLLDRSTRPFSLTPSGTVFRSPAQVILNTTHEARAALTTPHPPLRTLRLGMIEDFEADVTPRLLTGLSDQLPDCRFLLETGPSHRLLDGLDTRALDVILAADLPGAPPEERREVHPVLSEPFVAVCPKGAQPADLPLIHYTARHLMGRQIADHLARIGVRPASRFELDSYHAILAMVAAGAGWAILPPLALHQARRFRPAVEVQPLPFEPFGRQLSLSARAQVLGEIPGQISSLIKGLIQSDVVDPLHAAWPWLAKDLRVL